MVHSDLGRRRLTLGLNSGTSCDGIDVALVRSDGEAAELLDHCTVEYPDRLQAELLESRAADALGLARLHRRVGVAFAEAAVGALRRFEVSPGSLDVVGTHGQTVAHRHPVEGDVVTLQLGEPAYLAAALDVPVVHDFRQADLAVGGCGAPLVPLLDWLLLRPQTGARLALNLGGLGNLTVITPELDGVVALDTGPANAPLDLVARRLPGSPAFDMDGRAASAGRVQERLLSRLLDDERLSRPPPRSFDRDEFGIDLVERADSLSPQLAPQDLLATVTELVAATVERSIRLLVPDLASVDRLVVSGGGARNRHLMERIGARLPALRVADSADLGMDPEAKEAVLFAVLAVRHRRGLVGNLPHVTGASRSVVLGKLQPPLGPAPSGVRGRSTAQ